jgi:hypothetical protein
LFGHQLDRRRTNKLWSSIGLQIFHHYSFCLYIHEKKFSQRAQTVGLLVEKFNNPILVIGVGK